MDSFLMHYGTPGMKWGVRKYQFKGSSKRTPAGKKRYAHSQTEQLADKIHKKAIKSEPKITKDVTSAIKSIGARVYGLKHRLKTKESLERKIVADSKQKQISLSESANNVKDAIRYTAVLDDDRFSDGYNQIRDSLENAGYKETQCKNYFDLYRQGKSNHKQITSVYSDSKGTVFELQYHTPSSIKVKEEKTPLYEEVRKTNISTKRKNEITKRMDTLAARVKTPKGVYTIKSHS